MENPGPSGLNNNQDAATNQSSQEARRLSIQRCIQSLVHACQCRSANCSLPSCQKMKRVVQHTKGCQRKTKGGCPVCKQLIALCCYHAKHCQERVCPVPFCLNIKQKLRQQQLQHRLHQAQMLRRRVASMQREGQPGCAGLPSPAANNGAGPGPAVGSQHRLQQRRPEEPQLEQPRLELWRLEKRLLKQRQLQQEQRQLRQEQRQQEQRQQEQRRLEQRRLEQAQMLRRRHHCAKRG